MLSLKIFVVSLCLVAVASRQLEISLMKDIKICKGPIKGPVIIHGYTCSCSCHIGILICPKCTSVTTTIVTVTPSTTVEPIYEYCMGKEDHVIRPSDPCPCQCLGGHMACPTCVDTTPTTQLTPTTAS